VRSAAVCYAAAWPAVHSAAAQAPVCSATTQAAAWPAVCAAAA
jgi:hypothetical protein